MTGGAARVVYLGTMSSRVRGEGRPDRNGLCSLQLFGVLDEVTDETYNTRAP